MRGRLLSLLRAARGAKTNSGQQINSDNINLAPISPRRLAGFAHDIARGMEYISERKVSKFISNYFYYFCTLLMCEKFFHYYKRLNREIFLICFT